MIHWLGDIYKKENLMSGKNYFLTEYCERIKKTDRIEGSVKLLAFGVFGEVGSILSATKKKEREGEYLYDFGESIKEELGDVLWYFCRLIDSIGFSINELIPENEPEETNLISTNMPSTPLASMISIKETDKENALLSLGKSAAKLLSLPDSKDEKREVVKEFFNCYLSILRSFEISFSSVIEGNIDKTESRFLHEGNIDLPDFDSKYEDDERLPKTFEIEIMQKSNKKTYMKWKGVFIGDPLTDNIGEEDYYRFHDVFHMANAAILHWSPTFRSLIKHKRKSNPKVDEQEDGGRAIVIEEGITAWIFSIAKENNYFEGYEKLSFGMLKNIKKFVKGYEVEECPLYLWERSILEGYKVFRELIKHKSGWVEGNRESRTIKFKGIES